MADLFLSYSRRDQQFVKKLFERLEQDDRKVWVDWENIPLTAEWLEEIYDGIEAANAFAFVISPDSVRSEVCSLELNHALEHNKRLLPILHRDLVEEVDKKALHPTISSHNWIFFRDSDDFEEAYRAMREALDTDLDYLRIHTRLLVRAVEWNDKERDTSLVLRGSDLREAVRWLDNAADKHPPPTDLHEDYIRASQRAAAARRRVVVLTMIYGFVVLALALFAFSQAVTAENERQIALQNEATAVSAQSTSQVNEANAVAAQATSVYNEQQAQSLFLASNAQQRLYRENNRGLALSLALAANDTANPPPLAQSILAQAAYAPGARVVFDGVQGATSQGAVYADGTRMLIPVSGGGVAEVDLTTETTLATWGESSVLALAINPEETQALVSFQGEELGSLVLYDLETRDELQRWDDIDLSYDVAFVPGGDQVAYVPFETGTVFLLDATTGEEIRTFQPEPEVYHIGFNATGTLMVTSSTTGAIDLWQVRTGDRIRTFSIPDVAAWGADIAPDGSQVIGAYGDGVVYLWNTQSGEIIHRLNGHARLVWDVAFAPDGQTAVSGAYDNNVIHWDLETGSIINEFLGHRSAVYDVTFSDDGQRVLSTAFDGSARLWDLYNGAQIQAMLAHTATVWDVASLETEAGFQVITVGSDATPRRWDPMTGRLIQTYATGDAESEALTGHTNTIYTVDISPDATRMVTASRDNRAIVWDIETGEIISSFEGHGGRAFVARWHPDGESILSGGDFEEDDSVSGQLFRWDAETGTVLQAYHREDEPEQRIWDVRFNEAGTRFVSAGVEGTFKLWDAETGEVIREFVGHNSPVYNVVFSPDETLLLSASEDRSIRVWDIVTGEQVTRLDGHLAAVHMAQFNGNGTRVLSASADSSLRLWDLASSAEVQQFDGHTATVYAAIWGPDDDTAISVSADNSVRTWRVTSPQELVRWLEANRFVPELTCEQRDLYRIEPLCDNAEAN